MPRAASSRTRRRSSAGRAATLLHVASAMWMLIGREEVTFRHANDARARRRTRAAAGARGPAAATARGFAAAGTRDPALGTDLAAPLSHRRARLARFRDRHDPRRQHHR